MQGVVLCRLLDVLVAARGSVPAADRVAATVDQAIDVHGDRPEGAGALGGQRVTGEVGGAHLDQLSGGHLPAQISGPLDAVGLPAQYLPGVSDGALGGECDRYMAWFCDRSVACRPDTSPKAVILNGVAIYRGA